MATSIKAVSCLDTASGIVFNVLPRPGVGSVSGAAIFCDKVLRRVMSTREPLPLPDGDPAPKTLEG